jgi:hypothetical protein
VIALLATLVGGALTLTGVVITHSFNRRRAAEDFERQRLLAHRADLSQVLDEAARALAEQAEVLERIVLAADQYALTAAGWMGARSVGGEYEEMRRASMDRSFKGLDAAAEALEALLPAVRPLRERLRLRLPPDAAVLRDYWTAVEESISARNGAVAMLLDPTDPDTLSLRLRGLSRNEARATDRRAAFASSVRVQLGREDVAPPRDPGRVGRLRARLTPRNRWRRDGQAVQGPTGSLLAPGGDEGDDAAAGRNAASPT